MTAVATPLWCASTASVPTSRIGDTAFGGARKPIKSQNQGAPGRWLRKLGAAVAALFCSPIFLTAQNSSVTTPEAASRQRLYAERCAGCHGPDIRGTDQGPPLAGNPLAHRMTVQRLKAVIRNGIPNAGMPPFDLPAADLEALASFVHSLNSQAAESSVPGDAAAGEKFFFGKGRCSSCHMVMGNGRPIGPDLSDLGNERTVTEIESALKQPSADFAPGYDLVSVKLRDGKVVRGFARSRTNFDMSVEDLDGKLHLIEAGQIASIAEDHHSP